MAGAALAACPLTFSCAATEWLASSAIPTAMIPNATVIFRIALPPKPSREDTLECEEKLSVYFITERFHSMIYSRITHRITMQSKTPDPH
jgi:hypothetical protein